MKLLKGAAGAFFAALLSSTALIAPAGAADTAVHNMTAASSMPATSCLYADWWNGAAFVDRAICQNWAAAIGAVPLGGDAGTPSAISLANGTGLPIAGITGFGANVAALLATPSSANLLAALTTKTGTGLAVFGTSPVLTTPNLGIPSAVDLTNASNVPMAAALGILAGSKGGTANGFMQFSGPTTSTKTFALPDASATILTSNAAVTPAQGGSGFAGGYSAGQLLIGKTDGTLARAGLTAGSNVTITPGDGTITIAATGGSGTPAGVSGDFQINSAGSFGALTPAAGIATFLATPTSANLRAALTDEVGTGAAYFVGGALGTPASATLTNATGLPVSTGISGFGASVATFLATPSSANLLAALTTKTGTGSAVFGTAPTMTGVTLGDITGSTQCLHVSTLGAVTGTGSDCGSSGGSLTVSDTHGNSGAVSTISFAAGNIVTISGSTATLKSTNEITPSAAATYTLAGSDAGTTVHLTNAAPAVTVTAAGTLGNGYGSSVQSENAFTVAPASGTINASGSTIPLAAHQTFITWTDGTSLFGGVLPATDPSNAGNLISGIVPVVRLGSSGTRDATTVLHGDNTWSAPVGSGTVASGTANQIARYASTGTTVSGDASLTDDGSTVTATHALALPGVITDTIAADQNDYNPTGLATASMIIIDGGSAARTLTGLTAQPNGTRMTIVNGGTTNPISLSALNASSSANNRFDLDASTSIPQNHGAMTLRYVTTGGLNKWIPEGRTHQTVDYPLGGIPGVSPNKWVVFTAPRNMIVTGITGRLVTAAGAPAAITLKKAADGSACDDSNGTALHTGTFNANSTPNTKQTLALSATVSDLQLSTNDAVCLTTADGAAFIAGTALWTFTVSARAR